MLAQLAAIIGIGAKRPVAPASAPTLTWRSAANNGAGGVPKTFSAMAFGAAATDREMIAVVTAHYSLGSSRNGIIGVTIGGVAATIDITNSGSAQTHIAIARALVPTGTSGNVVVTTDTGLGDADQWHCSLYSITGRSVVGAGPVDTAIQSTSYQASPVPTVSIDVNETGVIVAGLDHIGFSGGTTWVGATKDYDGTSNPKASSAHYVATSAEVNHVISWTGGNSSVSCVTAAASYS